MMSSILVLFVYIYNFVTFIFKLLWHLKLWFSQNQSINIIAQLFMRSSQYMYTTSCLLTLLRLSNHFLSYLNNHLMLSRNLSAHVLIWQFCHVLNDFRTVVASLPNHSGLLIHAKIQCLMTGHNEKHNEAVHRFNSNVSM